MEPGTDKGFGDLLRSLPREEPPAVTLETILDRWLRQRRARLLSGAFAVAAGVMVILALPGPSREVPVHLEIRVIEAPQESEAADISEALTLASAPEELESP